MIILASCVLPTQTWDHASEGGDHHPQPASGWKPVLWIQIHWIWNRIQNFGPIWIRIQIQGYNPGINFEKKDDYPVHTIPNHHPTKMDVLQKTFVQNILAAKWLVRHSSTSPKQQRWPLTSLLSLSYFYEYTMYWSYRSKDDLSPPRYRNVNGRNFTAIMPRIVACMLPDGIQAPDKGPDYCVHCYKTCELQWSNFYLKKFKIVVGISLNN